MAIVCSLKSVQNEVFDINNLLGNMDFLPNFSCWLVFEKNIHNFINESLCVMLITVIY